VAGDRFHADDLDHGEPGDTKTHYASRHDTAREDKREARARAGITEGLLARRCRLESVRDLQNDCAGLS